MAEARSLADQFSGDLYKCPICLNLLKDPVTIPCGRSFCKVCINAFWHQEVIYCCPQCRRTFTPRPVLCSNNLLAGKLKNICHPHNNEEQSLSKSELNKDQMKFQQRIQEMQKVVQELQQAVDTIKEEAELIRAERLLEQLEEEIADLQRRFTELSFQSLCVSSGRDDSSSITVSQRLSFDALRKSLSDLKKRLEEIHKEKYIKIPERAVVPSEPSREYFLNYFCYLTLDENTAHRFLILSEKDKVVTDSRKHQPYSDHPERFVDYCQVLSKETLSGRCYWEVEWSSEECVYIAVSYKSIRRKGRGDEGWFGGNNKSWGLRCSPSSLSFRHNNINTDLSGPSSSRIGVYVDHSAGTLSFYSVSDTMKLLHRVHTTFTQPLYAGFWLRCYGSTVRLCEPKEM
ncbi:E3 ubiquitin/ISG15 ligase TRIM25-like isoform X3 [Hemibagrus wyckioides]|uniref:E3 ubiquitin/ISG15 ligase TRIM25-like isoform X3 n=1 Tax=Hemibagrus wyckioides TaxID=337641 RepID=UPI00266D4757|nr:E3 ubiquitin/ISG15 ligase TRIM25-like isoform X3 [Hemibagrus wyckioides]